MTDNEGNLPNALVYIENRQERITSNIDGSFILNNIPDGSYKLIIEYKGYDNLSVPFTISGTTPVSLGLIKLGSTKVKENNIQGVVVTSVYKASQARAITMKKNSNTITEVLSADAIGKLPTVMPPTLYNECRVYLLNGIWERTFCCCKRNTYTMDSIYTQWKQNAECQWRQC